VTTVHEEVRPIRDADAPVLAHLEASARAAVVGTRGGDSWLTETPAVGDWTTVVDDPLRPVWVATIDDHVVGFLELACHGSIAEVRQVYVQPEARELGLGDELLATAMTTARRLGCTRLEGAALPGDRHTKNLYERAGVVARKIIVSSPL